MDDDPQRCCKDKKFAWQNMNQNWPAMVKGINSECMESVRHIKDPQQTSEKKTKWDKLD